jgi:xanthine dehydrogenase accessory factor
MMTLEMSRRAQELAAQGVAFVTATVVRAQRPTSAQAGDSALVLGDGTVEGFVGGVCAEHSVRAYSLLAMEQDEAVLLRILPFSAQDDAAGAADEVSSEDGAVTVQNQCLSGGAIEVFLEPVLPAPRVLVARSDRRSRRHRHRCSHPRRGGTLDPGPDRRGPARRARQRFRARVRGAQRER